MPIATLLHDIGSELAAFLTAGVCAGCDVPGRLLCENCRSALTPDAVGLRTAGGLEVRAALSFDGVVARCIRALKGEGATLLARPLGHALATVLDELPGLEADIEVVPIPTSRAAFRRRGYRVPELLVRHAGAHPRRLLLSTGRSSDQRGLGALERAENVQGSMRARRRAQGRRVVIVDDVVTTGATFDEAVRVLEEAGCRVISAVALAATPRHRERTGNPYTTRRK